jgi:hypothetical protein
MVSKIHVSFVHERHRSADFFDISFLLSFRRCAMSAKQLVLIVIVTTLIYVSFSMTTAGARDHSDSKNLDRIYTLPKSVPALLNYQGYLATADSGAVNETLAMTFRLFDSAEGGTQLWSETHSAVEVSNGGFTLLLGSVTPFPTDLFDGSILYLQMEVGTEVFTPRKAIVSVAYSVRSDEATHAARADSAAQATLADEANHTAMADSATYAAEAGHSVHADTAAYSPGTNPWSVSGDDVYRESGNVGIGTASPTTELEVIGTVDADAYTVNGVPIGTSTDTYWNRTGDDIYYIAGNVGVGTASPTARLQVDDTKGHEGSLCSADYAVYGKNSGGNEGHLGSTSYGASGRNATSSNYGHLGTPDKGAEGVNDNGNWGALGMSNYGAHGQHSNGNEGHLGTASYGAAGRNAASDNYGMLGTPYRGAEGVNSNGNNGALGDSAYGAYGINSNGNEGKLGTTSYGAAGKNVTSGNYGMLGTPDRGAEGVNNNGHWGALGTDNYAVYGQHSGGNYGFFGGSQVGAFGQYNASNYGYLGGDQVGVFGQNGNGNCGYIGGSGEGVWALHNNGNIGRLADSDHGAYGQYSNGNFGTLGEQDYAVYAQHNSGSFGWLGHLHQGAYGQHSNGNYGGLGGENQGVYGYNASSNCAGHLASASRGVSGSHPSGNSGYIANQNHGVYGVNNNGNNGFLGGANAAVGGNAFSGYAGYFVGDVHVSNNLSKGGGSFKIDHPLDPENKYLYHSFVESPDMMNVYNGNVVLDAAGRAWVELPEWFQVVNRDFRYQLTCIGGFAPVFIAEKISDNRFQIAGGQPGMEVSWQVTGIRQDPYANLYRIPVEEDKPPEERGYYLHPEAYGLPEEQGVGWLYHPDRLDSMKETTAASKRTVEQALAPVKAASRVKVPAKIAKPQNLQPENGKSDLEPVPKEH